VGGPAGVAEATVAAATTTRTDTRPAATPA